MRRTLALHLALGVVLGVTSCADADGDAPPLLRKEGDPCRASYAFCIDDESARECVDEVWTDRSCAESCAELGPAMISAGCFEASLEILEEGCVCVPEPGACAPGDTRCDSETELGYCDDEQIWTSHSCEDLCAASLATPVSIGCDVDEEDEEGVAACYCQAEPG